MRGTHKKHVCERCGVRSANVTKHSLRGHHRPPFIWLCRSCHDLEHLTVRKAKNPTRV